MIWDLPVSVNVQGVSYEIRTDYRDILNICTALADQELDGEEKSAALLGIFYPGIDEMPPEHWREAIDCCFWFINGGQEQQKRRSRRLVDWEQDFPYICGPVNRVIGEEVRAMEYMHWWTFLAAYMEIGDCTFAQIVRIRDKIASGKSMDKSEKAWYRQNKDLVDFKTKYTSADEDLMREWSGS